MMLAVEGMIGPVAPAAKIPVVMNPLTNAVPAGMTAADVMRRPGTAATYSPMSV